MKNFVTAIVGILTGLCIAILIALLFSLPVMWFWNWVMPIIFGLTKITWLQAFGLMVLSGMLFRCSTSTAKK